MKTKSTRTPGALEFLTSSDHSHVDGWVATICHAAAEGTVSRQARGTVRVPTSGTSAAPGSDGRYRARTCIRRYVVANDLTEMLTLTFRRIGSSAAMRCEMTNFRRRFLRNLGERTPWLWVAERGQKTGRPHVHLALSPAAIDAAITAWKAGAAHRSSDGDHTSRELAEYLTKDLGDPYRIGSPRYHKAKGFEPEVYGVTCATRDGAIAVLRGAFPGAELGYEAEGSHGSVRLEFEL